MCTPEEACFTNKASILPAKSGILGLAGFTFAMGRDDIGICGDDLVDMTLSRTVRKWVVEGKRQILRGCGDVCYWEDNILKELHRRSSPFALCCPSS